MNIKRQKKMNFSKLRILSEQEKMEIGAGSSVKTAKSVNELSYCQEWVNNHIGTVMLTLVCILNLVNLGIIMFKVWDKNGKDNIFAATAEAYTNSKTRVATILATLVCIGAVLPSIYSKIMGIYGSKVEAYKNMMSIGQFCLFTIPFSIYRTLGLNVDDNKG